MSEERTSRQQTLEQERAASAWNNVDEVSVDIGEKYGSQARRLPSLIQVNGLGQTLAFLCSKPDRADMKEIYKHLSDWVMSQMPGQGKLLDAVRGWSSDTYRQATAEAIAYAMWLRRFAEAKGWGEREQDE